MMTLRTRLVPAVLTVLALATGSLQADDRREVTVGMTGNIEQVVLPGSELEARPIEEGSPIVLRVVDVAPHGSDMRRYDLEYYGTQAGEYDLADYLQRKDGSEMGELPAIPVMVTSILTADRVEPSAPAASRVARIGGYRTLIAAGAVLWILMLLAILFLRRGKGGEADTERASEKTTLADRLRPKIEAAIAGNLARTELAELEMMLIALWRSRLGWDDLPASEAARKLRSHRKAGPLLAQLEQWLHRPATQNPAVDVAALLEPYKNVSAEEFQESGQNTIADTNAREISIHSFT